MGTLFLAATSIALVIQWKYSLMSIGGGVGIPLSTSGLKTQHTSLLSFNREKFEFGTLTSFQLKLELGDYQVVAWIRSGVFNCVSKSALTAW